MARRYIRPRLTDQAGNVLEGALLRVLEAGTSTTVDLYAASAGGSVLSQPRTTDARGEVEVWLVDGTGDIDLEWSADLGVTTVAASGRTTTFSTFTEFVEAPSEGVTTHAALPDLATSGHPAGVISGLGGAATKNVGTTAGTVAAGDDSRITGAVPKSTVTTAGDLIYGTGSAAVSRLGIGSALQVLRTNAGATAPEWATVSSGAPTPRRFVLPSSAHYLTPVTISDIDGAFQTSSLAQQAMWWPCYTHRDVTVAALATYCGTLEAGSTMRFGLYANTGSDLAVGSLLADFGTVSGASTGAKEVTGSQAVSAGWFWVCNWISNHTTVRWLRRSLASGLPPSFAGVQNAYGRQYMGYKATSVDYSAGLPSSPPALTLMDHVTDTQASFPYWRFT